MPVPAHTHADKSSASSSATDWSSESKCSNPSGYLYYSRAVPLFAERKQAIALANTSLLSNVKEFLIVSVCWQKLNDFETEVLFHHGFITIMRMIIDHMQASLQTWIVPLLTVINPRTPEIQPSETEPEPFCTLRYPSATGCIAVYGLGSWRCDASAFFACMYARRNIW